MRSKQQTDKQTDRPNYISGSIGLTLLLPPSRPLRYCSANALHCSSTMPEYRAHNSCHKTLNMLSYLVNSGRLHTIALSNMNPRSARAGGIENVSWYICHDEILLTFDKFDDISFLEIRAGEHSGRSGEPGLRQGTGRRQTGQKRLQDQSVPNSWTLKIKGCLWKFLKIADIWWNRR